MRRSGQAAIAVTTRGFLFLLGLACLFNAPAGAGGNRTAANAERRAWRYTQKDLSVTITHKGGKEWVAERSDGNRPAYDEIERTGEYITLQNRETKLFVRLHADQAFWRRPKDENWTPWVRGAWVDAPVRPAAIAPAHDRRIRLAYFIPRDRSPTPNYQQKIRVVMAIVAELYLQDLRSKGYRTEGLRFETEGSQPVVHLVRGEREASYYNNSPAYTADQQWQRLLPEIRSKAGDSQRQVVVVFTETYDDGPAEHLWPGVIARGAYFTADGGLAVFSAHLLRDEFCAVTLEAQRRLLFDQTPVRGRKAWGHRIDSPRCEFVEDGIGAVAHELGHALGLPHDRREDTRDIMGNGFRNLRWNFGEPSGKRIGFSEENAWLLMSSRYLATDLRMTDNQPPQVERVQIAKDQAGWTATVRASDNTGLRAVVFIDRSAGSVVTGRKLSGTAQEFRQRLPGTDARSRGVRLQVIVTDDGGNQTRKLAGPPA
jgi:putative peptidase family protein